MEGPEEVIWIETKKKWEGTIPGKGREEKSPGRGNKEFGALRKLRRGPESWGQRRIDDEAEGRWKSEHVQDYRQETYINLQCNGSHRVH